MNIFFTSDTHFGHNNIISYCDRPDETTSQMDQRLIDNWNRVVQKGDIVYHLGDFSFHRKKEEVEKLLILLNGQIHLVLGNHDHDCIRKAKGWASVTAMKDIKVKYIDKQGITRFQEITLCHYAMKVWKHSGYGAWQLYGHSHGTLPDDSSAFQMDVGVDANNFTPISFYQVKAFMEKKYYLPKDYHGHAGVSTIPEHLTKKQDCGRIDIWNKDYDKATWNEEWDKVFGEK